MSGLFHQSHLLPQPQIPPHTTHLLAIFICSCEVKQKGITIIFNCSVGDFCVGPFSEYNIIRYRHNNRRNNKINPPSPSYNVSSLGCFQTVNLYTCTAIEDAHTHVIIDLLYGSFYC